MTGNNQLVPQGAPNTDDLDVIVSVVDSFVKKTYLDSLPLIDVLDVPDEIKKLNVRDNFRLCKLNKITYNKNEDNLQKLTSVYNSIYNISGSLLLVINSDGESIDFYLGTKTPHSEYISASSVQETLFKSLKGNFNGSAFEVCDNSEIEAIIERMFESEFESTSRSVASVTGVPALKDEKNDKKYVQGIERYVDAMQGEKYTAVFISDPIPKQELISIRNGYEILYTQLFPFGQNDLSFGENDSKSVSESLSKGTSESISNSLSKTKPNLIAAAAPVIAATAIVGGAVAIVGTGGAAAAAIPAIGCAMPVVSAAIGKIFTDETENESTSTSTSKNYSVSESVSTGSSKTAQIKFENKTVKSLLKNIEKQLERLEECEDLGMWNSAAYFIGEDSQTALLAATNFNSLLRGKSSAVESSAISLWTEHQQDKLDKIKGYLAKFSHPVFNPEAYNGINLPNLTAGAIISGKELAIQCNIPNKSIKGVVALEVAEFGRNFAVSDGPDAKTIDLGHIYHMDSVEDTAVKLDVQSLSMHTFVTGSTGTGKSNTNYVLLSELNRQGVKFLVIEPAKGEYKAVFGGRKNVSVFGTNKQYMKLLRINPFKFPKEIHVLEHIDKLIEIFNASWPMYAAMPAILKESIERIYISKGWTLEESICQGELKYPDFSDLLKLLPIVINESEYAGEAKSNYIGSLVTRVKSMTNGILGRVFSTNEIDNEILFDQNCVIDLSRVGSSETKALITGIVFMRLLEHRMAYTEGTDVSLRHVTLLEEAHNLLRRTSMEQSAEGSNLQGKAVEMISNAIAEMRTYGEGFIIADQAPNLLDQSVIRNTNTKIIMKLPEEGDRTSIGKAANLNNEQIDELSKLKTGVAAVYQNNWLEPILCKINRFTDKRPHNYQKEIASDNAKKLRLMQLLFQKKLKLDLDFDQTDLAELFEWVKGYDYSIAVRDLIRANLEVYEKSGTMDLWNFASRNEVSAVVFETFEAKRIVLPATDMTELERFHECLLENLAQEIHIEDSRLAFEILNSIVRSFAQNSESFNNVYIAWNKLARSKLNQEVTA